MNKYTRLIKDHIWGPTGSIIFHAGILFLLVRFLVFDTRQDQAVVEIRMDVISPQVELEPFEQEMEELEDIPEVVDAVPVPIVSPDHEPPVLDALDASPSADVGEIDFLETTSPVVFRDLYSSRSGDGRGEGLRRYSEGMGGMTEAAVMKALRWLKDHQYPDGSWGPQYRAAMTGLALLTFLAHGETTGSEEFGDCVRRGLRYLLSRQDNRGWFQGGGPAYSNSRAQYRVYEHVIATYAIGEAYGLTMIPMLRIALEDAVQVIIDGQLENGGWAYDFSRDGPMHVDVSLGGWIIQTLKAAVMAGAQNRGLKMALENGIRGIRTMTDPMNSGMFGYSTRVANHPPDQIMTGVAVLALQLTGYVGSEEARLGIRTLRTLNFNWQHEAADRNNHRNAVGSWPLYAWYYITQARFQHSPESWRPWNRQFAPGLAGMQNPDGSWCPPPDSTEGSFGPVYCTTLPALMLQVYYRLLPTFQPIPMEDAPTLADADEVQQITIRFE